MKENENILYQARKEAAEYNPKLYSREGAAELLAVHPSTLADWELGVTKNIPADRVIVMADLYRKPELIPYYCKNMCPIGGYLPMVAEVRSLEGIALRLLKGFDFDELGAMKKSLVEITADGVISDDEKPALQKIITQLNKMTEAISELKLIGEKCLKD